MQGPYQSPKAVSTPVTVPGAAKHQLHPTFHLFSVRFPIFFSKIKMIIRVFSSFILLGWVTSVYCSFPCLSLLPSTWGQALWVGSSGQGRMWLLRLRPQMVEKIQPKHPISCEVPLLSLLSLLLVLIFLLLMLLLSWTEIPTSGFFPNRNIMSVFEGNPWTKQAMGQKPPKHFRVGWSSWMGKSLGRSWEQGGTKVLRLEALNLSERCREKYK